MLRTVHATRYVLPLREGGSLPAIVEADDLGLYVVKFRGAGQGVLALIAALIVPDAPDAVDPERSLESLAIGTSLEDLPDSVSRFNRFRSARMSEAC